MSKAVKNLFDSISTKYDFLNHFLSAGRDIAWRKKACALLEPQKEVTVLDLCGGTGDFLDTFIKKGHQVNSSVIGDFSFGMLKEARHKFPQFKTYQLDALHPPFAPASFDIVLCGFGMRNLDSLDKGIDEVYQLLKPGGTFITLEFFRPLRLVPKTFYHGIAPLFIPLFGALFSGRKSAYEYLVNSVKKFLSADSYRQKLEQKGFEKVEVHDCDFGLAQIVIGQKNLGDKA